MNIFGISTGGTGYTRSSRRRRTYTTRKDV